MIQYLYNYTWEITHPRVPMLILSNGKLTLIRMSARKGRT